MKHFEIVSFGMVMSLLYQVLVIRSIIVGKKSLKGYVCPMNYAEGVFRTIFKLLSLLKGEGPCE